MQVYIHKSKDDAGRAAAQAGGDAIRQAISEQGQVNIILATGTSQFAMLEQLTDLSGIDWSVVTAYHLDEYCDIDKDHPVSFRRYMRERFSDKLPTLRRFVWIEGDAVDRDREIKRLNADIDAHPINIAFIGVGENGHLAFNDPPADFNATAPFLLVEPDEKSCLQQVREGWFKTVEDVPKYAISMSLRQILKSKQLLITVSDERKAEAVGAALEGPICRSCPASILRVHRDVALHLDRFAASNLDYFSHWSPS